jgi:hypothetical protein
LVEIKSASNFSYLFCVGDAVPREKVHSRGVICILHIGGENQSITVAVYPKSSGGTIRITTVTVKPNRTGSCCKRCGLVASGVMSSFFQEAADLFGLRRSMNSLANQNDECAYSNGKKGIVEEGHESWTP